MAVLAVAQDVADIFRPLSSAETSQATNLLAKASALLRLRLANIDSRITLFSTNPADPTALDPLIVANVVAQMVKRVLVNPSGVANRSISADGVSRSDSFGSLVNSGGTDGLGELVLTAADVAKLTPVSGSPGMPGSIRLSTPFAPIPCLLSGGPEDLAFEKIEPGEIYGPYYG